jgi:hypothetical protein
MSALEQDISELELALLRRGVVDLEAERVHCRRCDRTPLTGERLYRYTGGHVLCELCRRDESGEPIESMLVHGPEFGHSLRVTDRRAA